MVFRAGWLLEGEDDHKDRDAQQAEGEAGAERAALGRLLFGPQIPAGPVVPLMWVQQFVACHVSLLLGWAGAIAPAS